MLWFIIINVLSYKANPQDIIRINEKNEQEVLVSQIFESAKVVRLETSNKCLISNISALKVDSNRIFIFDRRVESVFAFNLEGKFLNKIGSKGKGPGEFIGPSDISLDRENKNIEILDYHAQKILVYDYDGNYIRSQNAFMVEDFEKVNHFSYLGYTYNFPFIAKDKVIKSVLAAFNKEGKIVKEFKNIGKIPRRINPITGSNMCQDEKGDIFLVPILENSLFRVDETLQIKKICDFQFDSHIPKRILDGVSDMKAAFQKYLDLNVPFFISMVNVLGDQLYLSFLYKREAYSFFWNMNTGKTITVANKKLINDLAMVESFGFSGIYNEGLIAITTAQIFTESFKKNDIQSVSNSEYLSRMVKELTPEDNPILIFYKYK
ncbi:MAG: 6-bladed beta-propeller [Candidatus Hodarchaeales archaeon]